MGIFETNNLDNGIIQYIEEINNLGYKTVMSCSGMKKDHVDATKCPFICFEWPRLPGQDLFLFLSFIGDCLYNSNWDVVYFPHYVIGYLPCGLNDTDIKVRFKKFVINLKIMNFLKQSYLNIL